uniref:Shaggy-related protein kinase eta n=1 Tax=Arundo donax TaxID=35708 RepID=A0A0A9EWZ5_ARUDO
MSRPSIGRGSREGIAGRCHRIPLDAIEDWGEEQDRGRHRYVPLEASMALRLRMGRRNRIDDVEGGEKEKGIDHRLGGLTWWAPSGDDGAGAAVGARRDIGSPQPGGGMRRGWSGGDRSRAGC